MKTRSSFQLLAFLQNRFGPLMSIVHHDFRLGEFKILKLILQNMDSTTKISKVYEEDMKEELGISSNAMHVVVDTLLNRTIQLNIPDGSILIGKWIIGFSKPVDKSLYEFRLDEVIIPYLEDLKTSLKQYDPENALKLNNEYSLRMYELCVSEGASGVFEASIEMLRDIVGELKEDQYKLYADFKRKILIRAIDEVSEKTDIAIELEEIKEGRKVVSVKFIVNPKKSRQLTLSDVSRAVIDTAKQKEIKISV